MYVHMAVLILVHDKFTGVKLAGRFPLVTLFRVGFNTSFVPLTWKISTAELDAVLFI